MIKWVLGITIAVVFAVSMMIFLPPAYAPHASAVPFSFVASTTDVLPNIIMTGHGAWKVGGKIGAGGTFTTSTGLTGNWHALSLYTTSNPLTSCPPCTTTTTSSNAVVFKAKFIPTGPSSSKFQADVVIGTNDIRTGNDPTFENFWVRDPSGTNFGFGATASLTFR